MAQDANGELTILRPGDPCPPTLPAVAQLFQQAKSTNLVPVILLYGADTATARSLAKRRHDVKAALRTLGFTVNALTSGYTFQDDLAAAKIEAITRAVQLLDRESSLLGALFDIE